MSPPDRRTAGPGGRVGPVGRRGRRPGGRVGSAGRGNPVGWSDEALALAAASVAWVVAALVPAGPVPKVVVAVGAALSALGLWRWAHPSPDGARRLAVVLVLVGIGLVAGQRAAEAAHHWRPLAGGPLTGPVTLLDDPRPIGVAGWVAEIRLPAGERVEATAFGRAGSELRRLGVGDRAVVEGRLRPVGDRGWLRTRHIVARASLSTVEPAGGPGPARAGVEAVRARIAAGGAGLDDRQRALFLGLVLGDDRFQPAGQVLRFRLTGLSHLLAVSGQNVAFVLTALAPALGRLGGRTRLAAMLGALVMFALITRLEPSVLRAVATAGLSAWATTTGRARSGVGVLATAVTILVWADPFLVDSVGFQLSVAASAGILLLGPALVARLPGPEVVVNPLAVSLAAQAGVAPLLGHYFGPVSLVAIPANLLAGWAAALIMVWGLSIGPLLPLVPGPVAALARLPVDLALWWLEAVAAVGARLPAPRPGLGIVVGLALLGLLARALRSRWPGRAVLVAAVLVVATTTPSAPDRPTRCGAGAHWFPAGSRSPPAGGEPGRSVLVLDGEAGPRSVEHCRRAGIRSIDVAVVLVGDRAAGAAVAALREVADVGEVWAPPQHAVVGARRRLGAARLATGAGVLTVSPGPEGRRLEVVVGP